MQENITGFCWLARSLLLTRHFAVGVRGITFKDGVLGVVSPMLTIAEICPAYRGKVKYFSIYAIKKNYMNAAPAKLKARGDPQLELKNR